MTHFLRLPPEIRFKIYEYCLVVGKIYPYRWKQSVTEEHASIPHAIEEHPLLCIGLVGANRLIYAETSSIVYKCNTVVLPDAPLTAMFFQKCLDDTQKRLWLKSIELGFSPSDMPASVKNSLIQPSHSFSQQHASLLHHIGHIIWPAKIAVILDHTKLENLTVNLSKCGCPMDCCPSHYKALSGFRKGFASGMVPELHFRELAPPLYRPVECIIPANPDVDERDFVGMALPVVFDQSDKKKVSARASRMGERQSDEKQVSAIALRMGEQIARWTKARELGKEEGYGDYRWFNSEVQTDDELDSWLAPGAPLGRHRRE